MQYASHLRGRALMLVSASALAGCLVGGAGPSVARERVGMSPGPLPSAISTAAVKTIAFSETAHLHAVSKGGSALEEEGRATGTFDCSITVRLVIVSAELVKATFTVKPRGGTVSGSGSARLQAEGSTGYFGGTLAITKGTGVFAHASGRNIGLSGSFNRETYRATVRVHGSVRI